MTKPTLLQGARILELFARLRFTSQQVDSLLDSGLLATFLEVANAPEFARLDREQLRAKFGLPSQSCEYKKTYLGEVIIADHETLNSMAITADYGGFPLHIDAICQRKITVRGSRRLHLVQPITRMDTSEVLHALSREDRFELAQVEDLMAVGMHPKFKLVAAQQEIISLATPMTYDGNQRAPRLIYRKGKLWLEFAVFNRVWSGPSCFLLVEKKVAAQSALAAMTTSAV